MLDLTVKKYQHIGLSDYNTYESLVCTGIELSAVKEDARKIMFLEEMHTKRFVELLLQVIPYSINPLLNLYMGTVYNSLLRQEAHY